jgi:PEP-CTERM motif
MKSLPAFLALVTLTLFTINLHADPIVTLNTGVVSDTLIETPILGGEQFAFVDITTDVLQTTIQTFTATYTDILGVSLLNVTDICAQVNILVPADPCQALAFSYTDASLGTASLIGALGAVGVDLNGNVADINFGASIGGGSAEIGFGNPPPNGGSPSPVPEPGSLSLMATGLLGAAGAIRRKCAAAA